MIPGHEDVLYGTDVLTTLVDELEANDLGPE
jgi:hypothetical protein